MKKKNDKKFFYSEIEDKIIVNSVSEDFKQRQAERKAYELAWELNLNFYLGNQFSYITDTGALSDSEKRFYWESREVYNHVAPIIEARVAKLGKINPNLEATPASNSEKDIYSAKVASSVLLNVCNKNKFKSLVTLATYWSEITGTSFYKIAWNSERGDIIGKVDGSEIKSGDVEVSVCSPFEIYPDSNGSLEVDDCQSIIEARAYPASQVKATYNVDVEGGDIDIFELQNDTFKSGICGSSNITKIAHETKHDHVLLIERYEKPSKNNPNGKLTIICGDKLLYDGDLPYYVGENGERGYPFVRQVSNKQITSFWGASIIERIIPIQKAYNAIKNRKHELISRLASGVLSVEDGSVDIDNLEDEGLAPGKILIYRNGSTPPKFLEAGSIPSEIEQEEEKLLSEMNSLASVSDITINSSVPTNVSSGTAISLLIHQDESRLSLNAENIRQSILTVGRKILRLYKEYATTNRISKILDSKGTLELFYWNSSDLTNDDVSLQSNNELEESKAEKKEYVLKLIEKGVFEDESGNIPISTKNKILKLFEFENMEVSTNLKQLHKDRAENENLGLVELGDTLEIDDDEIHISEHIRYLISDNEKRIDKAKREKLISHIAEHRLKMKGEN